ncbi:MAG: YIP1 family protein [Chloroflexota bacterium]|nr:YIP1 family protein [Chloroflexota bacterium]
MQDAPERQLVNRMIRASRFERQLYAEVAADITATRPALQVVVIAALASAFATFLGYQLDPPDPAWFGLDESAADSIRESLLGTAFVLGFILTPILSIVGWLAWSGVAWFIGTRLIAPGMQQVEFLDVARATGFAQAPGVLGVVGFIPVLGFIVQLGVLLWLLATGFFAIRESMRLTDGQAIGTMVAGVIAYLIIIIVIGGTVLTGLIGAALIGAVP